MIREAQDSVGHILDGGRQGGSAWARFAAWLKDFGEAVDTSYEEIQDRRIGALEREILSLKAELQAMRG